LKILNGNNVFTMIGTKETDDTDNTRTVLSGNACSGFQGKIQYIATTATGEKII
jgi:hypothetical protein